jgi:hypothetical protein
MGMAGTVLRSLAATGLTLSLLVAPVSIASAFPLRDPQVVFASEDLQSALSPINVLTDQLDAQVWDASAYGNPTFTLMIELIPNAPFNTIGVYNTTVPASPLFSIFPGTASAGWFATAHLAGGNLAVTLFDPNSVIRSQITYAGVNALAFGFYLVSPAGTFYSEDSHNGGSPHVLTYLGTGSNFGDWWQCFESSTDPTASADFDDVVLLMQLVTPTPTHTSTWGRLKSLYRQ